jgi:hypothetical protein
MQWNAQRTIYSILDLPDDVSGSYENCVLTHLDLDAFAGTTNTGQCFVSNRNRVVFVLNNSAYEWLGLDSGPRPVVANAPMLRYVWRSPVYVMPYEASFSALKVTSRDNLFFGDLFVRIFCNGRIMIERSLIGFNTTSSISTKIIRLPSSFRGTDWQIEFTGTAPLDEFHLATSYEDLIES